MIRSARVLSGFLIILCFQAGGELTAGATGLPVPGSVLGLVCLVTALWTGWIRVESVAAAADALLEHLGLLFVPAGAGVMLHFGLIGREALPLCAALIVSTLVVLAATGFVAERIAKRGVSRDA